MNNYKAISFEVIEIWYNSSSTPFTFQPISEKSEKHYAIKIGDDVYPIGKKNYGMYICDQE